MEPTDKVLFLFRCAEQDVQPLIDTLHRLAGSVCDAVELGASGAIEITLADSLKVELLVEEFAAGAGKQGVEFELG